MGYNVYHITAFSTFNDVKKLITIEILKPDQPDMDTLENIKLRCQNRRVELGLSPYTELNPESNWSLMTLAEQLVGKKAASVLYQSFRDPEKYTDGESFVVIVEAR